MTTMKTRKGLETVRTIVGLLAFSLLKRVVAGAVSIEEFVKLQAAKRKAKEAAKAKEKEKEKPKEAEASAGKSDGKAADKADGAGAAKSDGKADAKGEAKSDAADAKAAKGAKESAGDSKESKGDSKQTKREKRCMDFPVLPNLSCPFQGFVEDPDDWDPNKTTMREVGRTASPHTELAHMLLCCRFAKMCPISAFTSRR